MSIRKTNLLLIKASDGMNEGNKASKSSVGEGEGDITNSAFTATNKKRDVNQNKSDSASPAEEAAQNVAGG